MLPQALPLTDRRKTAEPAAARGVRLFNIIAHYKGSFGCEIAFAGLFYNVYYVI
jgi:hypothetical protein